MANQLRAVPGWIIAASALALLAATSAHATALGYGSLAGTWETNAGPHPTQPNPTGSNVATWGNLILAADPGAFDIADFHLAGDSGNWPGTNPSGALNFFNTNSTNGTWQYLGGANDNNPIDLFLAVKYATHVSVFEYDHVLPFDTGNITSDPKVYFGLASEALAIAAGHVCFHSPGSSNPNYNANCMDLNPPGNNPQGISHVVGYWPPDSTTLPVEITQIEVPVPEPASLALLGTGLVGYGLLARRRRR